MTIVYLDTETTGLDPNIHEVWEIAYAKGDNPIKSSFVIPERLGDADPKALEVGQFAQRYQAPGEEVWGRFDTGLYESLRGATLVGANPAFDAAFLTAYFANTDNPAPWKYRLFDIEAYAMGALGYEVPQGLMRIVDDLRDKGYPIPAPDHTATGDVATLRACHLALKKEYAR